MSRKVVRLTLDHLAELPAPCRSCVFWELDPVRRRGSTTPAAEKEAWVSEVLREWGSCGRVALVDDAAGGLRPLRAGGVRARAPPPSRPHRSRSDAVLLTAVYVDPAARGGGLGRMLVRAMARDLDRARRIRAVEAFGDTRPAGARCRACAGRLPERRGLPDAPRAPDDAADADGPAQRRHLAGRGRGGPGAALGAVRPRRRATRAPPRRARAAAQVD